jgi:hypothetical protein
MSDPTGSSDPKSAPTSPSPDLTRSWLDNIMPLLGVPQTGAQNAAPNAAPNLFSQQARDLVAKKFEEEEAKKAAKSAGPPAPPRRPEQDNPAFQYPTTENVILEPGDELRAGAKYAKLPKDLREKMTCEVWDEIGRQGQQASLTDIYLRLRKFGIWKEVKRVTGIQEKLPWHGKLGPFEFSVHGTGGIAFEANNATTLVQKFVGTGHFGQDDKLMSLMHPGQASVREYEDAMKVVPKGALDNSVHEWTARDPYPTSSMHVSVGPGNKFDAHIDRISPVSKPTGGQSNSKFPDAIEHIDYEVVGPMTGGVRLPRVTTDRVQVGPNQVKKVHNVWVINFAFEWDIFSGNTATNKPAPKPAPPIEPVPGDLQKEIFAQAGKIRQRFPKTSEGDIDVAELAVFIAGSILAAAKKGKTSIGVPFPNYSETQLTDAEQKVVQDAVRDIGKIVANVLGEKAGKVNNVTVYLPAQKAINVPIKK